MEPLLKLYFLMQLLVLLGCCWVTSSENSKQIVAVNERNAQDVAEEYRMSFFEQFLKTFKNRLGKRVFGGVPELRRMKRELAVDGREETQPYSYATNQKVSPVNVTSVDVKQVSKKSQIEDVSTLSLQSNLTLAPFMSDFNATDSSVPSLKPVDSDTKTQSLGVDPVLRNVTTNLGLLENNASKLLPNVSLPEPEAGPVSNHTEPLDNPNFAGNSSDPEPETSPEPYSGESSGKPEPETTPVPKTGESSGKPEPETTPEPRSGESSGKPEPETTPEPKSGESSGKPEPETTPEPRSGESSGKPEPETTPEPRSGESSGKPEPVTTPEPTLVASSRKPEPETTPEPKSSESSVKPAPETTPEPKSGESSGKAEPVSRAEPESTAEPGADDDNSKAEPEGGAETKRAYAEPVPIWFEAKATWGPAWEFHIYFVGLAFATLAMYSMISIIRLWKKRQLLSRGFFISLNIMLLLMGIMRSIYFLVDGYNSHDTFRPDAVDYFMYTTGFPCLTSAFSILFLALLQTTKVQFISPKIQRTRIIVGIIAFHFILSVTTDTVVGNVASARAMMFVCQLVSILWGMFLFIGYFYIFKTLYEAALRRQKDLLKLSLGKLRLPGINPIRKPPKLTLSLGVKVTLAASVVGLVYSGLQIYAMVGVYGVFSSTKVPAPWPWWSFKFSLRIVELLMCCLMSYVATQPFRYQKRPNRTVCDCFCLAPCHAICEGKEYETKEDSIYWNEIHGVTVSYNQEIYPHETGRLNTTRYAVSADEAVPLSSEEELSHSLQKSRSNTMDSDYGDLDLGSGPIVLNPHVLYQKNPEHLTLQDESKQKETKIDGIRNSHKSRRPKSIELDGGEVGESTDEPVKIPKNQPVYRQTTEAITETPNRKAGRATSFKSFLPKSPIKTNFSFLQSKPEQAGYSNLQDEKGQDTKPVVKRSTSEGSGSQVRTKSHQGSSYLSLSDLEIHSGVLESTECKGRAKNPTSPTIPEESYNGTDEIEVTKNPGE